MMNCKEATRMVSEGLDRDLALGEKLRLQLHLFICDYCRNFSKQGNFLRRAAQSANKRKSD
ncbi:zf-HC2 domain-containing protein [Chitinimonas sp. BJB300]|uniref:zf-HC2 domain-containing protein n=1 Tax=Chitinimonas sp. BJB300 TaxID=1559339 RepID=UPI000C0F7B57|nr:zf-HC2 domain-containing protein [Chitinimonas sp. BJB300]PHV12740.1 anti-sigma factor [Chitinimonas sp. BJB300]TSJ90919.1 zf-HC2 domain-containing protein [Chitinimonas sp. BJB300]